MNILPSVIGALIVITAYCMGVWTGSHFYCPRAGTSGVETEPMKRNDPMDRKSLIRKISDDGANCLNRPARKEDKGSIGLAGYVGASGAVGADTSVGEAERQTMREAERQKQTDTEKQKLADAERQRQFEEDLKAFEACMNYSAERAYDMLKGTGSE